MAIKLHREFVRINEQHPTLDSLSYPLLYPTGEIGWSPKMKVKRPTNLNQFYKEFVDDNLKKSFDELHLVY
jgi:hypothetical protein